MTFNPGDRSAGGTAAVVGLWNAFNRVPTGGFVSDSTGTWTCATAAWRAANNSATIRVTYVQGQPEDTWSARHNALTTPPSSGSGNAATGVGVDSTTAFTGTPALYSPGGSLTSETAEAMQRGAIGQHFMSAIEYVPSGTMSGYGAAGAPTDVQSGLSWSGRS